MNVRFFKQIHQLQLTLQKHYYYSFLSSIAKATVGFFFVLNGLWRSELKLRLLLLCSLCALQSKSKAPFAFFLGCVHTLIFAARLNIFSCRVKVNHYGCFILMRVTFFYFSYMVY